MWKIKFIENSKNWFKLIKKKREDNTNIIKVIAQEFTKKNEILKKIIVIKI